MRKYPGDTYPAPQVEYRDPIAHKTLEKYADKIITVREWNALMIEANHFYHWGMNEQSRALAQEIEARYGV